MKKNERNKSGTGVWLKAHRAKEKKRIKERKTGGRKMAENCEDSGENGKDEQR